jgi:hypothetical protein
MDSHTAQGIDGTRTGDSSTTQWPRTEWPRIGSLQQNADRGLKGRIGMSRWTITREMAGARGFEAPASWSRTIVRRGIQHLAGVRGVAHGCAELQWIKHLRPFRRDPCAKARSREKHGVGTNLVTASWDRVTTICLRTGRQLGIDFAPKAQVRVRLL